MKYKKGETFYVVTNGKVDKGVFIDDSDEPPIGMSIFRDKDAAEKMSKLINDATDKILRGNAFVLDAKVEKANDKDPQPTKEAWDTYTKVCVEETKTKEKDE